MDHKLTLSEHVNTIAKSSYAQLRFIALIHRYLTQGAAAMLIHSFVTSRLDNCNSHFYSLPDNMIRKLQCIQNHVTPLLHDLHWLLVSWAMCVSHYAHVRDTITSHPLTNLSHLVICVTCLEPNFRVVGCVSKKVGIARLSNHKLGLIC